MANDLERAVAAHYGGGALGEAILAGLKKSGADLDALTLARIIHRRHSEVRSAGPVAASLL